MTFGWKRLYKGKNEHGDLLLSDYRRERAAEKAEYSKSEYLRADELLTDKKKEVEQAQGELSRVTEELAK